MAKQISKDLDWHKDADGLYRFSRDGLLFYSIEEWNTWCEWKHFLKWQGLLWRKECSIDEFVQAVLDADYKYIHKELLEETA